MSKDKSEYLVERGDNIYEVVIGLEVHAQVTSNSKLFSSSSTTFGAEPNTQVSLVDAAFPGMLPVINEFCVQQAIKTGIGLKAQINKRSVFDRKNYFYADLPQGYQISQYKHPIVGEGKVTIDFKDGSSKDIRIVRLHLEQDAGKSLHAQNPTKTYVDLNRSGVALMEIVSEPDIRSADPKEKERAQQARTRLVDLIGKEFYCHTIMNKRGKAGRTLGHVYIIYANENRNDVNQILINEGLSTRYGD